MTKPGLREFHDFLTGDLRKHVLDAYVEHKIVSEADLQAYAWQLIGEFLAASASKHVFRVLNKPYCQDVGIHPDLVVFKRNKPWVVIELKEKRSLGERRARKEWQRLISARQVLRPRRGYLIYVARYGESKALTGPKGEGAKFFFEIPIILSEIWTRQKIEAWEQSFRRWSRFQVEAKKPSRTKALAAHA